MLLADQHRTIIASLVLWQFFTRIVVFPPMLQCGSVSFWRAIYMMALPLSLLFGNSSTTRRGASRGPSSQAGW
jgi:hypothetical protein